MEKIDFNKFFQSKTFKIILVAIGSLIVLLLVFGAGEFVGYRKARFSYSWGENYHRNFGGPRGGFFEWGRMPMSMMGPPSGDFIEGHGVFGSILKIDASTLLIKGEDNVERSVIVSDKTVITRGRSPMALGDLKVDDRVTVIGSPNAQGQIEAKFIRVFP